VGAGRAGDDFDRGADLSRGSHRIGLVNRVVEQAKLLAAARELASKILQNGTAAVTLCLQSVLRGLEMPFQAALEWEASQFGVCCGTQDAREGVRAFLEKRKPHFQGR
jgi:enoyl-CoA hydratase